jgi:hypothetical protein
MKHSPAQTQGSRDRLTTRQQRAAREKVARLMLDARWLHSITFTEEQRWRLIWTTGGAQRALFLKAMAASYDLMDDDHAPLAFTILAQSSDYAGLAPMVQPDVLTFWRDCCAEIGLIPDFDLCLAFVQIISA